MVGHLFWVDGGEWECTGNWAIPEKIQTGGVEDMKFPRVSKK